MLRVALQGGGVVLGLVAIALIARAVIRRLDAERSAARDAEARARAAAEVVAAAVAAGEVPPVVSVAPAAAPSRGVLRWLRFLTIDQWRAIDAETVRDPDDAGLGSLQVLVVLLTVAGALTLQEYLGGHDAYERLYKPGSRYWELTGFAWWSGWRVFGYVILPMLVIACLPGERIRDYHISLRGFGRHLWIYALMFGLILPAVIIASTTQSFRQTYPFYRLANRSYFDLVIWELLYAAQFLSLEFFFRGFLLQGLRRHLGANAIFVMLVPYCMIHYGKPMPETLGALGAGVILGTLAMRTRSIWGGVMIHVAVAITMDVLALRGCPPFGGLAGCH